jgi:hypothetical protein
MTASATNEADSLLRAFLDEPDEAKSGQILGELICNHAQPVIGRIIFSKLNVSRGRWDSVEWQDREDIGNEVIVQLIRRLIRMKDNGTEMLESFQSYVAVATYNACSTYVRQKYPDRLRLRGKLRYLLNRHDQFALWQGEGREWLCGLVGWRNQPCSGRDRLRQLRADPSALGLTTDSHDWGAQTLHLVKTIFEFARGPVGLEDLIDFVGDIPGVKDKTVRPEPDYETKRGVNSTYSYANADQDEMVETQTYLRQVWKEICELPIGQRMALLLNLNDDDGVSITTHFAGSCIATMREMADALALSMEEFRRLWGTLPLSDADIGARLGLSPTKVATLRQSARRRLSRRMRTFER